MVDSAIVLFGTGVGLLLYTYALYPGLLKLLGARKPGLGPSQDPETWPTVSVSLPAYNDVSAPLKSFFWQECCVRPPDNYRYIPGAEKLFYHFVCMFGITNDEADSDGVRFHFIKRRSHSGFSLVLI